MPMSAESKSSINWGMVCHVAGLTAYVGLPILGPLIVWLAKRKTDTIANIEGREAVNYNISVTLYAFISGLLCFVVIGYLLLVLVSMTHLGLVIWATLKANKGES